MLLVDKPSGPTSHDVVGRVRSVLGLKRVGHAGTLDPMATGLLVVLVGAATRLNQFVALLPKRYLGTVKFGWETATDDAAGEPATAPDSRWRELDDRAIRAALDAIAASETQVPPAVSARKVDGERAYRRVRRGEDVAMRAAPVRIDAIIAEPFDAVAGELRIAVTCGSGTYIRAIARDLGRALGTSAHLSMLRRTAIGPWRVDDALPLDAVETADLGPRIRPAAEAVAHLPRINLSAEDGRRFRFGQKFPGGDAGFELAAVFEGDALLGIANLRDGLLCPSVGLAS